MSARVELFIGALILFPEGPRTVVGISPIGYTTRDIAGTTTEVPWVDVAPARAVVSGHVDAVAESLMMVQSAFYNMERQQVSGYWNYVQDIQP